MKSFQVRFSDALHAEIENEAKVRGISMSDVVREGCEVHLMHTSLIREGGKVIHERPSGSRAEVVFLGVRPKTS